MVVATAATNDDDGREGIDDDTGGGEEWSGRHNGQKVQYRCQWSFHGGRGYVVEEEEECMLMTVWGNELVLGRWEERLENGVRM